MMTPIAVVSDKLDCRMLCDGAGGRDSGGRGGGRGGAPARAKTGVQEFKGKKMTFDE